MVEDLPCMGKALGLIPNTEIKDKEWERERKGKKKAERRDGERKRERRRGRHILTFQHSACLSYTLHIHAPEYSKVDFNSAFVENGQCS